jgi:predicted nucleotidyltransferase
MKMDKKPLDELLADLKVGLRGVYGERLKGLYMYGSYARGDQDEESDLDILVVLDQIDSYAREINRTSQLASDLSLKYGITVSKVFIRENQWLHGDTPFLSNVREEAVLL